MKKYNWKRSVGSLLLAGVLLTSGVAVRAAEYDDVILEEETIAPRYGIIQDHKALLDINDSNQAHCKAYAIVLSGYTASIVATLQRKTDAGWLTQDAWGATGQEATVNETVRVPEGYRYRLKLTVTVRDQNGKTVETLTEYSSIAP